jgi:hypothetical protein
MIIAAFSMDPINSTINKLSISIEIETNLEPRNPSTASGPERRNMMAELPSCSGIYPTNIRRKWSCKKLRPPDWNLSMTSFICPSILR